MQSDDQNTSVQQRRKVFRKIRKSIRKERWLQRQESGNTFYDASEGFTDDESELFRIPQPLLDEVIHTIPVIFYYPEFVHEVVKEKGVLPVSYLKLSEKEILDSDIVHASEGPRRSMSDPNLTLRQRPGQHPSINNSRNSDHAISSLSNLSQTHLAMDPMPLSVANGKNTLSDLINHLDIKLKTAGQHPEYRGISEPVMCDREISAIRQHQQYQGDSLRRQPDPDQTYKQGVCEGEGLVVHRNQQPRHQSDLHNIPEPGKYKAESGSIQQFQQRQGISPYHRPGLNRHSEPDVFPGRQSRALHTSLQKHGDPGNTIPQLSTNQGDSHQLNSIGNLQQREWDGKTQMRPQYSQFLENFEHHQSYGQSLPIPGMHEGESYPISLEQQYPYAEDEVHEPYSSITHGGDNMHGNLAIPPALAQNHCNIHPHVQTHPAYEHKYDDVGESQKMPQLVQTSITQKTATLPQQSYGRLPNKFPPLPTLQDDYDHLYKNQAMPQHTQVSISQNMQTAPLLTQPYVKLPHNILPPQTHLQSCDHKYESQAMSQQIHSNMSQNMATAPLLEPPHGQLPVPPNHSQYYDHMNQRQAIPQQAHTNLVNKMEVVPSIRQPHSENINQNWGVSLCHQYGYDQMSQGQTEPHHARMNVPTNLAIVAHRQQPHGDQQGPLGADSQQFSRTKHQDLQANPGAQLVHDDMVQIQQNLGAYQPQQRALEDGDQYMIFSPPPQQNHGLQKIAGLLSQQSQGGMRENQSADVAAQKTHDGMLQNSVATAPLKQAPQGTQKVHATNAALQQDHGDIQHHVDIHNHQVPENVYQKLVAFPPSQQVHDDRMNVRQSMPNNSVSQQAWDNFGAFLPSQQTREFQNPKPASHSTQSSGYINMHKSVIGASAAQHVLPQNMSAFSFSRQDHPRIQRSQPAAIPQNCNDQYQHQSLSNLTPHSAENSSLRSQLNFTHSVNNTLSESSLDSYYTRQTPFPHHRNTIEQNTSSEIPESSGNEHHMHSTTATGESIGTTIERRCRLLRDSSTLGVSDTSFNNPTVPRGARTPDWLHATPSHHMNCERKNSQAASNQTAIGSPLGSPGIRKKKR